jgi:hypothetical protein
MRHPRQIQRTALSAIGGRPGEHDDRRGEAAPWSSRATISPAVHCAWMTPPSRGTDGAGIVASSVNPDSDPALAL